MGSTKCNEINEKLNDKNFNVPYVAKQKLVDRLNKMRKARHTASKGDEKERLNRALEAVQEMAENLKPEQKFLVAQIDAGTKGASMKKVVKEFHKEAKVPCFFVSVDPDGGKTTVLVKAEIPKAAGSKLDAKNWV